MKKTFLLLLVVLTGFCRAQTGPGSAQCGDTKISFRQRCGGKGQLRNISLVHVHENETTAVAAGNWLIDSVGQACFTTWQCQGQRYITFRQQGKQYRFDPNRIFTDSGARATLNLKAGTRASAAVVSAVRNVADAFTEKYIDGRQLVVALHNNTDGGGLSARSYLKGGIYEKDAAQVYIHPQKDADDFLYVTEPEAFRFFQQRGFNVVLQHEASVQDDGSLSVYCGRKHIPYINIEAEQGHLQAQQAMLLAVWQYISDRY